MSTLAHLRDLTVGELLTMLGAATAPADDRGALVVLANGWGPLKPTTLRRWAREGRLRTHVLERGKLASWERDIRDAVEAGEPPPAARPAPVTDLDEWCRRNLG